MQLAGNGALPVGESVAKVDAALARMEKKGGETVESSLRSPYAHHARAHLLHASLRKPRPRPRQQEASDPGGIS